jgi:hypothetical protein
LKSYYGRKRATVLSCLGRTDCRQLTSGLHSKPQKMTGCRTLATWQRAPSYNALRWAVDCALSSSLLPSENLVMASVPESSQPDSDAEEDHLISHEYEDAKDRRIDELHYSRRRTWIPATTSSLVTLVVVTALLSMLLSGFALYFLHLLGPQQPSRIAHPQPGTRFGFCGDTPASARQANCTFDLMSFSWLPPACAETELTTEFLRLKNWTWWIDAEKNNPVPLHEVSKGEYRELYVTREYHMYHCTYM